LFCEGGERIGMAIGKGWREKGKRLKETMIFVR